MLTAENERGTLHYTVDGPPDEVLARIFSVSDEYENVWIKVTNSGLKP